MKTIYYTLSSVLQLVDLYSRSALGHLTCTRWVMEASRVVEGGVVEGGGSGGGGGLDEVNRVYGYDIYSMKLKTFYV